MNKLGRFSLTLVSALCVLSALSSLPAFAKDKPAEKAVLSSEQKLAIRTAQLAYASASLAAQPYKIEEERLRQAYIDVVRSTFKDLGLKQEEWTVDQLTLELAPAAKPADPAPKPDVAKDKK